jgi:hypothetical protein
MRGEWLIYGGGDADDDGDDVGDGNRNSDDDDVGGGGVDDGARSDGWFLVALGSMKWLPWRARRKAARTPKLEFFATCSSFPLCDARPDSYSSVS